MMDDETEAGAPPRATPKSASRDCDQSAAEPKSAAEQRAERLKAALRDNLRRRKAQLRGRAPDPPDARAKHPSRRRSLIARRKPPFRQNLAITVPFPRGRLTSRQVSISEFSGPQRRMRTGRAIWARF